MDEKKLTYHEIMEYIEQQNTRGSVLGLDSIRELCKRLDNPQDKLRFIHIAGTNGKGSTLAYISTVLKTAGYTVGRYISPVIFNYRERIQVNGKPILAKELTEIMNEVKEAADEMEKDGHPYPTVFELETVAGFCYFVEKACDIVVLETGMGGDLDATNIIQNTILTVFASISMDHMSFLGKTLKEIAEKKAGIIKPGARVVSTWQESSVKNVLEEKNKQLNHDLTVVIADRERLSGVKYGIKKQRFHYMCADGTLYKQMQIGLTGAVQIDNAVLALEALNQLRKMDFVISEEHIRKGLLQTKWPGRLEVIADKPLFIVDGAHNEDAAKRLAESIRFYFTNKKIIYIMGILKDKEYEKIVAETYAYAEHIITVTPPENPRALSAHDLAVCVGEYHPRVTEAASLEEAVEIAYMFAEKEDVILAFGSLSYLGRLVKLIESRKKQHGRSEKSKRSH